MIDWGNIIALIVAGLMGGGLVGWYTSRSVVAKNLSEAAGRLVESYGQRLHEIEAEQIKQTALSNRQRRYIRYLLDGIRTLMAQTKRQGETPDWAPEDIDVVCPEDRTA